MHTRGQSRLRVESRYECLRSRSVQSSRETALPPLRGRPARPAHQRHPPRAIEGRGLKRRPQLPAPLIPCRLSGRPAATAPCSPQPRAHCELIAGPPAAPHALACAPAQPTATQPRPRAAPPAFCPDCHPSHAEGLSCGKGPARDSDLVPLPALRPMSYFVPTRFVWRFGGRQVVAEAPRKCQAPELRPIPSSPADRRLPLTAGPPMWLLHTLGRDGAHGASRGLTGRFCRGGPPPAGVRRALRLQLSLSASGPPINSCYSPRVAQHTPEECLLLFACRYHQYKFIVDGKWRHDETAPFMPDPLGNVNNWLFVRRVEPSPQPLAR
jgi:hypothetical protein